MPEQSPYISLLYYILPSFILDSFELVKVEDRPVDHPTPELLYPSVLHIYLDERDNRTEEQASLFRPNGFTEATQVQDFPIRDRKTVLHIRRRRYMDAAGKNVIINNFNLSAHGTRYSHEFADFLKEILGYLPRDGGICGTTVDGRRLKT
ncbi:MAG: hypothetical protein K2I92_09020 [Muribaculaceae bacterium]|nr:hypothetical protein [Muribaculaceae bacterium]